MFRMKGLVGLGVLGVIAWGGGIDSAWAAGQQKAAPASVAAESSPATAPVELGLAFTKDGAFPKVVRATVNTPVTLWVVNGTKDKGTLSLALPRSVEVEAKPNAIVQVIIEPLAAGQYAIELKDKKNGQAGEAVLEIGPVPAEGRQEVTLMAGRFQFKPEVVRVRAGKPLAVYMYTSAGIPHGDIEIFGTSAKFKMKNQQLEKAELAEGLSAGEYPISRPGFPQQKHGITSRIMAE